MYRHTPTLILLSVTIGCAAEDRGTALSAGTSAAPHSARTSDGAAEIVRSSDTVRLISDLPLTAGGSPVTDGAAELVRSDDTVRLISDLPRTADGGPIAGDGTFHCASQALNFDLFLPETILIEATRTRDGLDTYTMRTGVHDTESDPVSEGEQLLTAFTWNADRIALSLDVEDTEIVLENVPGTAGRLFIGSGTTSHAPTIGFTCWDERISPKFTYDSETGLCTDAAGREGLNPWTIEMVRETGEAECADLRGAGLDDASITFAVIEDANLMAQISLV